MSDFRLRELYPIFDDALGYLVDLLVDGEIDSDELRRQASGDGYSEHDIQRAIAFGSDGLPD